MAIKEVEGYTWNNINATHSAEAIAKQFYGLPTAPENVTQDAFIGVHNVGSEGDFYYFIGDLDPLGNVKTFTINIDED